MLDQSDQPLNWLNNASLLAGFIDQADAPAESGIDVMWIETMSSNDEVAAVIESAKTTGLPICATVTFDTASRSIMGLCPLILLNLLAGWGPILLDLVAVSVRLIFCIRFVISLPHQAVC